MLTLDRMNKASGLVDRSIQVVASGAKTAFTPVHRFLFPRSHDYKWTPNKEVADSDAHSAMADIFQQGIKGCIRIDAIFLGIATALGLNFPTAMLVVAMHISLYTLWSYKVVGTWKTSSLNWMKVSMTWLIVISAVFATVAMFLAQIQPAWYSNSVMFFGTMALWMTQLVPMEKMVSRLAKEAPVAG